MYLHKICGKNNRLVQVYSGISNRTYHPKLNVLVFRCSDVTKEKDDIRPRKTAHTSKKSLVIRLSGTDDYTER